MKWIIRFVFLVAAANVLGMTQVSVLLNQILLWLPNLLIAVVILLVAPLLGRFVRGVIEVGAGQMGFGNARILGRIAEIAIVAFAVVIALYQIGIANDLISILFIGVVGAVAIAFGLAFGLGGREVAAEITRSWYTEMSAATAKVMEAAATGSDAETGLERPRPVRADDGTGLVRGRLTRGPIGRGPIPPGCSPRGTRASVESAERVERLRPLGDRVAAERAPAAGSPRGGSPTSARQPRSAKAVQGRQRGRRRPRSRAGREAPQRRRTARLPPARPRPGGRPALGGVAPVVRRRRGA